MHCSTGPESLIADSSESELCEGKLAAEECSKNDITANRRKLALKLLFAFLASLPAIYVLIAVLSLSQEELLRIYANSGEPYSISGAKRYLVRYIFRQTAAISAGMAFCRALMLLLERADGNPEILPKKWGDWIERQRVDTNAWWFKDLERFLQIGVTLWAFVIACSAAHYGF